MVVHSRKEGAGIVKRQRPTHQTRAKRARIDFWKRFGVWIFIVFFALSVAGGVIALSELRPK